MIERQFSDDDLAALYDVFYPPERRADMAFYLPLVMSAQAVLDVGCGTGALMHCAREAGHRGRLCGLDPAIGMLNQARARSEIEWVLGDLSTAHWDREFDLIVMTGHAFQQLLADDEIRAALDAIRTALTADGRFAFETRNPLARAWERWPADYSGEVIDAGVRVRCQYQVDAPLDGGIVRSTSTYTSPSWDRPRVSTGALRFLDVAELSAFLSGAGLEIEAQFGDWARQPLTDSSPEIITVARKRTPAHPLHFAAGKAE